MSPVAITLEAAGLASTGLTLGMLVLIRRIFSARLPVTAGWIDELSIERYRPMMHLLNSEDLAFLRAQPGFSPAMEAKLRAQRCQVFCGYLRSLNTDFSRICAAIKLLMLQSRDDRSDLAGFLLKQQALFTCAVAIVYAKLLLYRAGICGVDVTALVRIFDEMRRELRMLVPQNAAMSA